MAKSLALALTAALVTLGPAFAQAPPAERTGMPQPAEQFLSAMPATSMRVSKIVGAPVIGLDHRSIGTISEVLLGRDGKAEAVVIGSGGVAGIGGKEVALPYEAVLWNTGDATRAPGPSASRAPADAPTRRRSRRRAAQSACRARTCRTRRCAPRATSRARTSAPDPARFRPDRRSGRRCRLSVAARCRPWCA